MRRIWLTALFLCLGLVCGHAAAGAEASFQQSSNGVPLILLDGQWRFHPGDDPDGRLGWAKPGLDDSGWQLLQSDAPWSDQLSQNLTGYGWYRFRVTVPAHRGRYGILLPPFSTGYEIFADGQRIGSEGSYRQTAIPLLQMALVDYGVFPLPAAPTADAGAGQTYTIALRVWAQPNIANYYFAGPAHGGGVVGEWSRLKAMQQRRRDHELYLYSDNFAFSLLAFAISIFSIGLYWFRRTDSEYLWFALVPVMLGLNALLNIVFVVEWQAFPFWDLFSSATEIGYQVALLVFVSRILKTPLSRTRKLLIAAGCLSILTVPLYWTELVPAYLAGWIGIALVLPISLWVVWRLSVESLRGRVLARLMLGPVLLMTGLAILDDVTLTLAQLHWIQNPQIFETPIPIAGYHLHPTILAQTLFLLSMMGFLIDRFTRASRREEQMVASVEAARQVQRLLLPEAMPQVAGMKLECVYHPSERVGGDFFLVVPTESAGLILVLGDVSGKGLPASMLVATLIGAARAQVAITTDPVSILHALNTVLMAHRSGHFATCLVCHIAADGTATLASAGHPAPYWNGQEMEMDGALPLGITDRPDYADHTRRLHAGDRLVVISDGVLEAQDGHGNLMGFAAVAGLAHASAKAIAEAAIRMGQTDDITVLAVTMAAG